MKKSSHFFFTRRPNNVKRLFCVCTIHAYTRFLQTMANVWRKRVFTTPFMHVCYRGSWCCRETSFHYTQTVKPALFYGSVLCLQFFFVGGSLCSKRSVCVIMCHFTVIADALLHAGGWLFSITSSATYQYIYVSKKRLYLLRYFKNYNIPSQVISFCCRNNNINFGFWTTFTKYFWVCYSSSNVDAVTFR